MNLNQFIERLGKYRASAPPESSLSIVGMKGLRIEQFKWVLDEVRKAGVTRITIESDREPEPQTNSSTGF